MPTNRSRLARVLPGLAPGLLVIVAEVVVAVFLILYLREADHHLCTQLQRSRVVSNLTLRQPFRQFALEAAAVRERSGDHDVAVEYRRIAARVHDLPPLEC